MSAGESPTNRQSSGFDAENIQRREDHVRLGLGGKSIGALHVIEVGKQSEHFEHRACSRRALGGRGGFPARQSGQRFRDTRIGPRRRVTCGPDRRVR